MRHLATILITLALVVLAMSVELFRYLGAAKDGGTLEYVFEAGEQNSPDTVTKNKSRTQRISRQTFMAFILQARSEKH